MERGRAGEKVGEMGAERGQGRVGTAGNAGRERGGGWGEGSGERRKRVGVGGVVETDLRKLSFL